MNKKELGIYIHIPFCKQKCYYCDFISYTNKSDFIEKYINCVIKEIESYKFEGYQITTIYIGGGTPSFVDNKYIKKIVEKLSEKINMRDVKEFTIEVNPGTVNENKLQKYKEAGINRLSIGLQSTNNKLLREIGRIHTFEEFENTYLIARKVGFKNINVDLIIGLPNQTILDIKESLRKIVKLSPEHISVYSLIVEEGTKIAQKIEEGLLNLPEEELERNMYWYVKNSLELKGYTHYEISNFAKKGNESKHNLNCWKQKEYIGIGAAAHSYINSVRYSNTEDLEKYIKNVENNQIEKNRKIEEKQTKTDMKKEYMLLGLRTIEGISIREFKEKYIENPIYLYRKELEKLTKEKLIEIDGDNIQLTNKGIDLANIVWEEFV